MSPITTHSLNDFHLVDKKTLCLWKVPEDATAKLISISENITYLIEGTNWKSILRIYANKYRSKNAIQCELAWSQALNEDGIVITPHVYLGRNGDSIQSSYMKEYKDLRFLVMFQFIQGKPPRKDRNLTQLFEKLGKIAAKTHIHSISWERPKYFERLKWNLESIFGPKAHWGNWRNAPNVTRDIRQILEKVEETVSNRLDQFGTTSDRYGLIHADMRLSNLLTYHEKIRLIDFDDCGTGWFLYDFAASISFMDDHENIQILKESWIRGYRIMRDLSKDCIDEIDTLIMFRRLALLAWIQSHMESIEFQTFSPDFARITAKLGQKYLEFYH